MDSNDNNNKDSSEAHRVLVLQGGGALGAYEAGVYDVLYFWIKKDQDIANPLNKHNIFDVVAGTSIGAINAAILVSYVMENHGSWQGSTHKLLDFWEHVSSTPDLINYWPYWSNWPFPWNEKSWMEAGIDEVKLIIILPQVRRPEDTIPQKSSWYRVLQIFFQSQQKPMTIDFLMIFSLLQ
ncbi:MAG: patatin-like phospholipase family protein [Nitrososphaeraceae archaeon]